MRRGVPGGGTSPETRDLPDTDASSRSPARKGSLARSASANASAVNVQGRSWRPLLLGRSRAWRGVPLTAGKGRATVCE